MYEEIGGIFASGEKIWRLWKAGYSTRGIGRALGRRFGSVYLLLAPYGGIEQPAHGSAAYAEAGGTRGYLAWLGGGLLNPPDRRASLLGAFPGDGARIELEPRTGAPGPIVLQFIRHQGLQPIVQRQHTRLRAQCPPPSRSQPG